jgi:drug/metabolite transporter (DMT)-like permease
VGDVSRLTSIAGYDGDNRMSRDPAPIAAEPPSPDVRTGQGRFPLGLRFMVASAFFFAVMSLLVKLAGRRFPVMELVFARAAVVTALAWVAIRWKRTSLRSPDLALLVLRGVFGLAALTCFYYAVVHLPLAVATVIHFTNPVFTFIIAAIFLGEALRARELGLALASLAGVVLVIRPLSLLRGVGGFEPLAVAASLAGALLAAAAYTLVRRLRRNDPMVVVFYFAAVSVVAAGPVMLPSLVRPAGWDWALLLGVGGATFLGQLFLTLGLQRERAGRAMSVGYLQIVFAAVWGFLIFAEVPTLSTVVGGVVVVLCTILLGRLRQEEETST